MGEDGQFYYSNGLEWIVPIEDNEILRPSALVPFSVDERTQLRLTTFRSPAGLEQTGIIFEISTNGVDFDGSITRIVPGFGNLYQIEFPEDGFGPGDRVLWRAAYTGTGGAQSNFSVPYAQTLATARTIYVPLGGGTVNNPLDVTIDWGDGSSERFTTPGIKPHLFAEGAGPRVTVSALGLDAFAIGNQLAVKPLQQRFVGESTACDGRDQRQKPTDKRSNGGGQTMVAEGCGSGGQEAGRCRITHAEAPIEKV